MLRFIRQHPIAGLIAALSLEAWIAWPGEALISIAASSLVGRAWGLVRLAASGLAGMLVNDLALFGLSRLGRGVLAHFINPARFQLHLNGLEMVGAKFLPPFRSAAYMLYGLQGTTLTRFLTVSLISSALWILVYALLGKQFQAPINRMMKSAEGRARWVTAFEVGLSLLAIALVVRPIFMA